MVLFDLKDGYCSTDLRLAKRFCCREQAEPSRHFTLDTLFSSSLRPFATANATTDLVAISSRALEECAEWRTWDQFFREKTGSSKAAGSVAKYAFYILIALAFSTLSSFLTLTLTRSDSVYSVSWLPFDRFTEKL